MTDTRVFIHIGLPKTASTLLQTLVFPNIEGVTHISRPYTQENHAFNKLQYADDSLYDPEELRSELRYILGARTSDTPLLISDELLSGTPFYNFLNRGLIAHRLAEVLPQSEIILFLRGQRSIIRSLYNQYVKLGWCTDELDSHFISQPGPGFSLREFLAGNRSWNIRNRYISHRSYMNQQHFLYYELVRFYKHTFGKVHVFLYEDLATEPHSILGKLADLFETHIPDGVLRAVQSTNVNPGLDDDALVRKLMQNRLQVLHQRARGRCGRMASRVLAALLKTGRFQQRQKEYLDRLMNRNVFTPNNRLLNERYPEIGIGRHPEAYQL